MTEPGPLDRRAFLAGLAGTGAALLAGCTATSSSASSARSASSASSASSAGAPGTSATGSASPVATSAAPHLPATSPWRPTANEISAQVKLRAVRLLEALGTWSSASSDSAGRPGLPAAHVRIARLGYAPALADAATALLGSSGSAVVQVVDAQYGGILASSSSVLVVLKQWRTGPGGATVLAGGTTVDVRLVAASPFWRVTAVHPAEPSPPAARLSPQVSALLASTRLHLPVAARADLGSGTISAGVVSALRGLSAAHVVDVSVVKSGHPLYVFGTSRLSDHPRGHAVDVWAVDGHPVVDPANRPLVESVMRLGIALGAYQVGGPVDLDGGGLQYFSDNTHHDHIHLGFHG